MSAAGRWFVTPHAVQRYRERIDPRATYEQALGVLVRESESARPVKPWKGGAMLYKGSKLSRGAHLRMVVGCDKASGLPQLITVLPPHPGWRPPTPAGPEGRALRSGSVRSK